VPKGGKTTEPDQEAHVGRLSGNEDLGTGWGSKSSIPKPLKTRGKWGAGKNPPWTNEDESSTMNVGIRGVNQKGGW